MSPLFVVFTARPTDREVRGPAAEASSEKLDDSAIQLTALSEMEVQQLLAGALGVSEVPKSVYEVVYKRNARHTRADAASCNRHVTVM